MRFSTRLRVAVITAALVLVAASCGASVPESTIDSLRSTTTTATTIPDSDTAPGTTESTTASTSTTLEKKGSASGGDFCEEMGRFAAMDDAGLGDDLDLGGDDFDEAQLSDMKKAMAEMDEIFARATAAAPAEIADDMKVMASVFADLNEAVSKAETPDELFGAFLSLALGDIDEAELEEAGDRIEAFVEDECGIDLSALD